MGPLLGVVALGGGLFALGGAAPAGAGQTTFPKRFLPESAPLATFSTKSDLTPSCPQALAGTPGSDPATKSINTALTNDFGPGGTVHYVYTDNPHANSGTQNYTIQDCVVTYPEGYFGDGFTTGTPPASKWTLSGGTQIDGASLTGMTTAPENKVIYFSWTAPGDLAPGTIVCNFARDIANNHAGGGNRKVLPVCYTVTGTPPPPPPNTNLTPDIFVGYADDLHEGTVNETPFNPTPWEGSPGVVFLGCTDGTTGCDKFDGGAIRVLNPTTNGPLTLTAASVDVTSANGADTCQFHPWDNMVPATAAPGGSFVLTQTGTLGAPQAAPCDNAIGTVGLRAITNFDTSEGPNDSPGIYNCDQPPSRPAVIHLSLTDGAGSYTLTVTDADRILTTGGHDSFACANQDEAHEFTPVPDAATNVIRT